MQYSVYPRINKVACDMFNATVGPTSNAEGFELQAVGASTTA
jgi:hypothetical protein